MEDLIMKTIKKIVFVLTAIALLIGCIPMVFAEDYTSGDWNYIDIDGGICITRYRGGDTVVEIPESLDGKTVTALLGGAFTESNISDLSVPSTVKFMCWHRQRSNYGNSALYNMTSLRTLRFAQNMDVPYGAATGNTSVQTVIIPGGRTIGSSAFKNCSSLTTVSMDNVSTIGQYAFAGCASLTGMDFPDTLEKLDEHAIEGANLQTVTLPKSIKTIGCFAFADNKAIKTIELPEGLKTIDSSAFSGTGITEMLIPSTVTSMSGALQGMDELKVLRFADNMDVPNGAAINNKSVQTVEIPGAYTIGAGAFANCSSLTDVSMSDYVTTIGNNAFKNCKGLKTISMPAKLKMIGQSAFEGVDLELVSLPKSLTTISASAFANNKAIKAIELPEGLQEIGGSAFAGTNISELTIPSNVRKMNSVNASSSFGALYGMSALKTLRFSENMDIPYGAAKDNTSIEMVVIPADVKKINAYAFSGCSAIKNVSMTEVQTIEYDAFHGCSSMTEILLPDTLETIGNNAFNGANLNSVKIPAGVKTIGKNAFANNRNIKEVDLPEGLEVIGSFAFAGTRIEEITIPSTVTSMNRGEGFHDSALDGMSFLTSVTFADGMKTIPAGAVRNCSSIETINVYDNIGNVNEIETYFKDTTYNKNLVVNILPHVDDAKDTDPEAPDTNDDNIDPSDDILNGNCSDSATGDHTWDSGIVTKPATCALEGEKTYKCSVCGAVKTEAISKDTDAHTGKTEIVNVKEATETEDGYTGDTVCKDCGKVLKNGETIPKIKLNVVYGDVNGDNQVLANDARLALRASAHLENLDARQFKAADVDGNGQVLANDARQILRYSAKLQNSFDKAA